MALPQIIELKDKNWLFKVTEQSREPELNLCLFGFFLGSGMTTLEICRVQVKDVIKKNGELAKFFVVKGDVEREFHLSNPELKSLIKRYMKKRKIDGDHPDQYQACNPSSPFFIRNNGDHFNVKKRESDKGAITYHCNALNNHIKRLLAESGIEKPSILSGRRTLAVRLKRHGVVEPVIHKMLGNKMLETTRRLIDSDTVDMVAIAEMAL